MLDEEWPWLLQKVGPFRELTRLLDAAEAAQIPVVLCSDYPVEAKIKALGLSDRPWRARLDATTFGALKPRPEVYLAAAAALNLPPGEVLHVGDSPWLDVEGARGVGMMTALVGRHDAPGATWRSPHMNRFCVEAAQALAQQPQGSQP
jgi:FMN phosphatase YigB (HAD superfamily)